jgi:hypothetical protein
MKLEQPASSGPAAGPTVPAACLGHADPHVRAAAEAAAALAAASESADFAGWDVFDALTSPVLARLPSSPLVRRVALQVLKRSPVQLRGVLRVPKLQHTKGLALFASAYARLAAADGAPGDARAGQVATDLAGRLVERAIARPSGVGWGYDFPVQLRWGAYQPGEPNAVGTAFAGHALLDVAALVGDDRLVEVARDAARYAITELLTERDGGRYFAYYAGATAAIHNSSLLLASLCVRALPPGDSHLEAAGDAIRYSVERQRADGSWPYGEEPNLGWVDGFHTAYNLDALDLWQRATGDEPARAALERGLDLYVARLIDPDGAARASLESRYPVDIHAVATAISTLSTLDRNGWGTGDTAERVLDWTLANMRRGDGRFAFQKHRRYRNSVPYIRWGDGHMLLGLANYLTGREST